MDETPQKLLFRMKSSLTEVLGVPSDAVSTTLHADKSGGIFIYRPRTRLDFGTEQAERLLTHPGTIHAARETLPLLDALYSIDRFANPKLTSLRATTGSLQIAYQLTAADPEEYESAHNVLQAARLGHHEYPGGQRCMKAGREYRRFTYHLNNAWIGLSIHKPNLP